MQFVYAASIVIVAWAVFMQYASHAEWWLHSRIMHRPFFGLRYPFVAHAQTHHKLFRADESYHLTNHKESEQKAHKKKIPMAWWNGPVLVFIGMIPIVAVTLPFAYAFGLWFEAKLVWTTGVATLSGYYCTYEYLHWCMHLPKSRRNKALRWSGRDGPHILHHRYPNKNFNVVYGAADRFRNTDLNRSPIRFAQVRGPGIPDLQPLAA